LLPKENTFGACRRVGFRSRRFRSCDSDPAVSIMISASGHNPTGADHSEPAFRARAPSTISRASSPMSSQNSTGA